MINTFVSQQIFSIFLSTNLKVSSSKELCWNSWRYDCFRIGVLNFKYLSIRNIDMFCSAIISKSFKVNFVSCIVNNFTTFSSKINYNWALLNNSYNISFSWRALTNMNCVADRYWAFFPIIRNFKSKESKSIWIYRQIWSCFSSRGLDFKVRSSWNRLIINWLDSEFSFNLISRIVAFLRVIKCSQTFLLKISNSELNLWWR